MSNIVVNNYLAAQKQVELGIEDGEIDPITFIETIDSFRRIVKEKKDAKIEAAYPNRFLTQIWQESTLVIDAVKSGVDISEQYFPEIEKFESKGIETFKFGPHIFSDYQNLYHSLFKDQEQPAVPKTPCEAFRVRNKAPLSVLLNSFGKDLLDISFRSTRQVSRFVSKYSMGLNNYFLIAKKIDGVYQYYVFNIWGLRNQATFDKLKKSENNAGNEAKIFIPKNKIILD